MLSISLGPLAFPVAPLPILAALLLAAWAAHRVGVRAHDRQSAGSRAASAGSAGSAASAESTVWAAALAGLLVARLVHVAVHADAYLETPWAMLDIRDGGWHAAAGWAAAAAVLGWRAVRSAALRPALAAAALTGVLVGVGGKLALVSALPDRASSSAPTVTLQALADAAAVRASGASSGVAPAAPSLADLVRGQPTVVNLWATWCAPCRAEMPMLAAAQQRHADVRFLFVNQGETAATVNRYLQREALPLRDVWLDADSALGPAVQSRGLPTTLFYDAQGRLVDAHMGLLNAASLRARLQALRDE